ncbi:PREDICTED: uncharacterized protein LOC104589970 [Nelumbo nucifera]|uniref:Uncharacterized protein LOC104589970 n=1 Tax=Nelumbo nucifera TaxID=4432 RepID=A0A1U8PZI5_NELNU|nr:PREDICTED: uncharacterized protein LOC104589970 [Nelumbo nucifera]
MAMIDCTFIDLYEEESHVIQRRASQFCNDQFKGTIFNQRKGGVDGILVQTLAVSLNDDGRVGILSGDSKEVKRFCQQREEEAYLELELHCLLIYLHYLLEMHIDRSYCRGRVHYGNSHHRVIGFVQSACVLV